MIIDPTKAILAEQLEEQPTQLTRIITKEQQRVEELTTLPEVEAAGQRKRIDLQPTQPMQMEQRRLEMLETAQVPAVERVQQLYRQNKSKQTTTPIVVMHPHDTLHWGILAPLYILLIASVLVGYAALANWFGVILLPAPANHTSTPVIITHVRHIPIHSSPIQIEAQTFMQAFLHKDWAVLWSMLSPNAQGLYNGESDFTHFEQAKFGQVTLKSYQTSIAELVQPWLDPDSTQVYALASVVHISLEVSASPGSLSTLSIADLQNGLFLNTTLAMIPQDGHWRVIIAGPADLDAPVLVPASPTATRLLVPVFMYHHVSNLPTENALDYSLTVTTTDFNAQLDWLQKQGYTSINMTELFNALYYGKALPAHPMILTFDDGYEDMYTDALPALLAHHDRGVFYIITGMIGGNYLTWNQVHVLQDEGMQIASHTVHHVNIGAPPSYTSTQAELTQSKATLQHELGVPIQFFCYPSGEPFHHDTVYEQQLVLKDLFNDGYIGATLDPSAFDSAIQDAQMPYQLPRVRVSGGEPLASFTGILDAVLTYDAGQISQQTGG